jgi:hypothetical protein
MMTDLFKKTGFLFLGVFFFLLLFLFFAKSPTMAVTCTEENIGSSCTTSGGESGFCRAISLEVYGCVPDYPDPPKLGGDGDGPSLVSITDKVLEQLFPIAGLIALIFVVIGGYMWMISAGDPNRVKQAQGTLTWAIIGLLVIAVIFGVLRVLINFLS